MNRVRWMIIGAALLLFVQFIGALLRAMHKTNVAHEIISRITAGHAQMAHVLTHGE